MSGARTTDANSESIAVSIRTDNDKLNLTLFVLILNILLYIIFPVGRIPVLITCHVHIRSPHKYGIGH